MKKILFIITAIILTICFVSACGNNEDAGKDQANQSSETTSLEQYTGEINLDDTFECEGCIFPVSSEWVKQVSDETTYFYSADGKSFIMFSSGYGSYPDNKYDGLDEFIQGLLHGVDNGNVLEKKFTILNDDTKALHIVFEGGINGSDATIDSYYINRGENRSMTVGFANRKNVNNEQMKAEFAEMISSMKVNAENTETVSYSENTKAADFSIIANVMGDYGFEKTLNAGTEFEETQIVYHIPEGTYTVTNNGGQTTQLSAYSDQTYVTEAGWEGPASVGDVIVLKPKESGTFSISDGFYLEAHFDGELVFYKQ